MAARTRRGRSPRNRIENVAQDEAPAPNGADGARDARKAKRKKSKKKDGKRSELDVLHEQAVRARRRFPKLFKFLSKRDEATFELVKGALEGEPAKVKFVNEALHLLETHRGCPVCKGKALQLLDREGRDWLSFVCYAGTFVRDTGIRALSKR